MNEQATKEFQEIDVNGIQPMPATDKEHHYTVNPKSQVLVTFVDTLLEAISVELMGTSLEAVVNEPKFRDDFLAYLSDEIIDRVNYSTNGKASVSPTDGAYHAVPSLISVMIQQIGVVESERFGLYVTPVLQEKMKVTLSPEDRRRFLTRLKKIFRAVGVVFADNVPLSRAGSPEFVMMTLIDEKVMSESIDSAPVYAVLATLVDLKAVDYLCPRVDYGRVSVIQRIINRNASEAVKHVG